ncbi:hypothetical protein Thpro_023193 [Acidihalobacter prosperus]|uniref:Diguanylate cyclase n=1 Tax=Acidihalobacter prosperus TaxID=160660 RepID=A0A1A6BZY5_9GAMM|nr:hypothetical protein Thpro_023193 [Acidihalobacter prosperus]
MWTQGKQGKGWLRRAGFLFLLFLLALFYGVQSWRDTRWHVEQALRASVRRGAEAEASSLTHWSAALRAMGNFLALGNDLRPAQVDTRIILFQSAYPDSVLPIFVLQAQDGRLLGASPIVGRAQSPYLRIAHRLCPLNRNASVTLAAPVHLPHELVSAGQDQALPACARIRDAGGDPILDVYALLPWPPTALATHRDLIAGHQPIYRLNWRGPGARQVSHSEQAEGEGARREAGQPEFPLRRHASTGIRIWTQQGRLYAQTSVAGFPLSVTASLPRAVIWREWLLQGGAGEGVVLLSLLTLVLGMSARRSTRIAKSESQLRTYYGALKDINQALVALPEPEKLYAKVCAQLAESADLPLVWIGLIQDSRVHVQRAAGPARGYVDGLEIDLAPDSPSSRGPAGEALRKGETVAVADLWDNAGFAFWLERATRYGLRSAVMTPFTTKAGQRGILAAYAQRRHYFTPALVELMEELARDVALGLNQYEHVREITRLSQQDSLTGLPNRSYFMRMLEQALARAGRAERLTAVGILDLDYFKQINDNLGHQVGDQVLQILARQLKEAVRQGDTVARLGGDEFGILLEGVSGTVELEGIAHRLLESVRQPIRIEGIGHELNTDASLGFTLYPLDDSSPMELLRHADAALYASKGAGRRRWQLFSHLMADDARLEYQVYRELPNALASQALFLHYQPQIDLATGAVIGVEALVRWRHNGDGFWMPNSFIPIIERDAALSRQLGRFLLHSAATAIARWRSDHYAFGRVSINICARHLQHSAFLDDLDETLDRYPGTAAYLTLELTETQALADLDKSARVLGEVRKRGIHVSLDDFGSGYASLQHVRELPLDVIKLDLQFVQNLEHDTEAFAVGYAALTLAEIHGAKVVAEGVEEARVVSLWRRLGGEVIQGYFFAKPMGERDWLDWLARYRPAARYAEIPRWRPTLDALVLLRTLPYHNQLMMRFRKQACADHKLSKNDLAELAASLSAPCPLGTWLKSEQAVSLDTVRLQQSHRLLHRQLLDWLATLSTGSPNSTSVEIDAVWTAFVDALDEVIEQMDARLRQEA